MSTTRGFTDKEFDNIERTFCNFGGPFQKTDMRFPYFKPIAIFLSMHQKICPAKEASSVIGNISPYITIFCVCVLLSVINVTVNEHVWHYMLMLSMI